jgi:hypothetical protein
MLKMAIERHYVVLDKHPSYKSARFELLRSLSAGLSDLSTQKSVPDFFFPT